MEQGNQRILIPRTEFIRLYEITPAAKGLEGPTLTEIAQDIISKIPNESFTTPQIEDIIEKKWPGYGQIRRWRDTELWFHFNIWPLFKMGERSAGISEDDKPEKGTYRLEKDEIEKFRQRLRAIKGKP